MDVPGHKHHPQERRGTGEAASRVRLRAAPATSTGREIVEGLRIVAPAALGYVPLGIAFGLLVAQSNLPWWMAPALSLTAYSGSAELLLVGLASAGTPLATIAVTTFLVNSRHVF